MIKAALECISPRKGVSLTKAGVHGVQTKAAFFIESIYDRHAVRQWWLIQNPVTRASLERGRWAKV